MVTDDLKLIGVDLAVHTDPDHEYLPGDLAYLRGLKSVARYTQETLSRLLDLPSTEVSIFQVFDIDNDVRWAYRFARSQGLPTMIAKWYAMGVADGSGGGRIRVTRFVPSEDTDATD